MGKQTQKLESRQKRPVRVNGCHKTIDVVNVGQQSRSMMWEGDVAVDF